MPSKKEKTIDQLEAMQAKAVRFAEDVLQDDDLADELDGLSTAEYAERKRVRIVPNPTAKEKQRAIMPTSKKQLQDENNELQNVLDDVGSRVLDMLDPSLTREDLVKQLKDLDSLVNDDSDEDDEDDEPEDEEDDEE